MVEKYDFVEERPEGPDGPVVRKAQSVTHIWTIDATSSTAAAAWSRRTSFAHGPGLLETRPGPSQDGQPDPGRAPDRTATWQDQLMVKNELGPDKKIAKRELVLKGSPRVVDRLKHRRSTRSTRSSSGSSPSRPRDAGTSATAKATPRNSDGGDPGAQGGSFQIERLLALRDVHLVAPSQEPDRSRTARRRLRGEPRSAIATRTTAQGPLSTPPRTASPSAAAAAAERPRRPTSRSAAKEKTTEPEHGRPGQPRGGQDPDRPGRETKAASKPTAPPRPRRRPPTPVDPATPTRTTRSATCGSSAQSALHQDPSPGKTKGQDASGETLILHNEGPGKAIFNLYHHDPDGGRERPRTATAPGPRPRSSPRT